MKRFLNQVQNSISLVSLINLLERIEINRKEVKSMKLYFQVCWACPKCRAEYSKHQRPTQYYCFCGKARDPKSTPWVAAHSCDQVCDRKLADCQHHCKLMCHPGPCPACPIVSAKLQIGRLAPVQRFN